MESKERRNLFSNYPRLKGKRKVSREKKERKKEGGERGPETLQMTLPIKKKKGLHYLSQEGKEEKSNGDIDSLGGEEKEKKLTKDHVYRLLMSVGGKKKNLYPRV